MNICCSFANSEGRKKKGTWGSFDWAKVTVKDIGWRISRPDFVVLFPVCNYYYVLGREPWSSGYGRRLMFQWLWVRILAPYTRWTFFHIFCCKNCNVCFKRQNKWKRGRGLTIFLKNDVRPKDKDSTCVCWNDSPKSTNHDRQDNWKNY